MKLHKIEKISCIIPFYSLFFISIVTMVELKRNKASKKRWLQVQGVLTLTFLLVGIIFACIPADAPEYIRWIVCAIISTGGNFLLIEIQRRAWLERPKEEPDLIPIQSEKKSKKGLWITLGIVGTIFFMIIVVAGAILYGESNNPYSKLEDTNGPENTSLAYITKEAMLTDEEHGSSWFVSEGQYGEQTNAKKYRNDDYDRIHFSAKKSSGISTKQATKIEEGTLTLKITSELTKGNAEIIIVIDGEYHSSVPLNETYTITLDDIAGKTVLVRMGCEAAEIDVTVERTIS